ncbi:spore germination lipoprotein GerD [Oceanobacillus jeddahense]|uniref:Spore germination lipoprotein GerD n=1 Tax=Oceanobacillus jeddahense TaxID=1462527 RepID=A0ABY5JWD9_9BACI|nr:spore germination lipoprotein GerD [Oceanobacillus jeddahense]UUI03371.1 spore germination lipoprotein GerD [Oceanobacillus jeddahense]
MKRHLSILFLVLFLSLAAACGNNEESRETEYETTKKMVVDILQTEEGKAALKDILNDDELQESIVIESDEVKGAVTKALSSDDSKENWKKMFQDPEFVQTYAKSISAEQKNLMKDLMHDSQFQEQMIEILRNPEVDEQMLSVMTSQAFRAHLEKTIQETLQSPLFQEKIEQALKEAANQNSSGNSGENNENSQSNNENESGEDPSSE